MSFSLFSSLSCTVAKKSASSVVATPGLNTISSSNLILYYSFESADITGSTLKNKITGGTNDLTVTGSTPISSTYINGTGSLKLSSSNNAYVSIASSYYSVTQSFALKIYLVSTTSQFVNFFTAYGGGFSWTLCYLQGYWALGTPNQGAFILRFILAGTIQEFVFSSNLPLNTWHSVAFTKNSNTFKAYLNGTEVSSQTGSNQDLTGHYSSTEFSIGRYMTNSTTASSDAISGFVDDFRFYNRVLTASEVSTLHTTYD
jgi:hypothetical protein